MTRADFKEIEFITEKEVRATGANPADVQKILLKNFDPLRRKIGLRFYLLSNGLTTGDHHAVEHGRGLAMDGYFRGRFEPNTVVEMALDAGFRGIGVYYNGNMISFHFDLRSLVQLWKAIKGPDGQWIYLPLYSDPR